MKIKRTIFLAILCTMSMVLFGLGIGYGLEIITKKNNDNVDSIPIVKSDKELKKILDSTESDYNTTKILIEGKILSKMVINKDGYYKNFIYVRQKEIDSDGKIVNEVCDSSRIGSINGAGINLSKILFINPDTIYSNNKYEITGVLNGQEGTMIAYTSLGEIKNGKFYLRKTAKDIVNDFKTDINETLKPFYIIWSIMTIGFCIIPFSILIHHKYKKGRMLKNDRTNNKSYNI